MATLASLISDYESNADFDETASATKAKAFVTVCRKLLVKLARGVQTGGAGGERVEMDPRLIREEMLAAKKWLLSTDAGASAVRYFDTSYYRD